MPATLSLWMVNGFMVFICKTPSVYRMGTMEWMRNQERDWMHVSRHYLEGPKQVRTKKAQERSSQTDTVQTSVQAGKT
jgi:hypothetical protein